MSIDFKSNFFTGGAKPAPEQTPAPPTQAMEILWANDPKFRVDFGQWLYENYSSLVDEYKTHGRFLSLKETENPLE
jgi:hypothetical protein